MSVKLNQTPITTTYKKTEVQKNSIAVKEEQESKDTLQEFKTSGLTIKDIPTETFIAYSKNNNNSPISKQAEKALNKIINNLPEDATFEELKNAIDDDKSIPKAEKEGVIVGLIIFLILGILVCSMDQPSARGTLSALEAYNKRYR